METADSTEVVSKVEENGDAEKESARVEEKKLIEGGAEEKKSLEESVEASSPPGKSEREMLQFVVIYNKNKHDISFPADDTIAKLKLHLQKIIGVPQSLQKVMIKGLAKDEKTLSEAGISAGAKVMVVGSKLDDVLAVSTTSSQVLTEEKAGATQSKEPLCKQKIHKKVIDRGIPDDVLPGILNTKEALPPFPLCGMVNKAGGKVRLTFKLELDQLWIGTKDRTDKIAMSSIKNIVSEPIEGHTEYHIMGIQLGTTEASRIWVYWVPAQYIDSIKDAVLGPWIV